MKAIVIADNRWGVSKNGKSLINIPLERKTMLELVSGSVVVYDYRYVDELPGQQALIGCDNIIFTDNAEVKVKNAALCKTLSEVEDEVKKRSGKEVYIIHGAKLYNFFYDQTDAWHVTKIDYTYNTDESIPDIDKDPRFKLVNDSDELYLHDMVYSFLEYEKIKETP